MMCLSRLCVKPKESLSVNVRRSISFSSSHGSARINFLVQKGSSIIPIEVKSGTQGSMQSLRFDMREKYIERGVRTSLENFGRYEDIDVYPLYAIGSLRRG